jgi:hypothetical protein
MKVKINELNGAPLDWAVAKCEGIELESGYGVQETSGYYNRLLVDGRMSKGQSMLVRYIPSTDWGKVGRSLNGSGLMLPRGPTNPTKICGGNASNTTTLTV